MDQIFFGFLALCCLVAFGMFLAFCYRQEKLKASGSAKASIEKDRVSIEAAVSVDKDNKKENNQ